MILRRTTVVRLAQTGDETALVALVIRARDAGVTQDETRAVFEAAAAALRDTDESAYDRILDVLDRIVGWCRRESRLFPST